VAGRLIEGEVASATARWPRPRALDGALAHVSWTVVALVAALAAVIAVQAPVLGHYFFGDDFVPLADIASRSTGGYLKDLFLLRDDTPNWRFLTGVVYLVLYRSFGLDALPFLVTNVVLHAATAGLVFWFVYRALGSAWPAFLAAAFFGATSAHVPTVGQVTALNNVLGAFFVMLALVLLIEGLDRRSMYAWLAASILSFAAAIASNESAAAVAPVFALVLLWRGGASWRERRSWARPLVLALPFVALGGVALVGFGACGCTEGADVYVWDERVLTNVWLYLGRLLYPVEIGAPNEISKAQLVAGSATLVVAYAAVVRGPALARIAVVFLALALAPYLPNGLWSAARYTYLASIPFSILGALLFREAGRYAGRLAPAAAVSIALVAVGVLGLYAWQSWSQNEAFDAESERWEQLVAGVRDAYPELPAGATVYVRGGPVTGYLFQCTALPAAGQAVWGDVNLFTFLGGDLDGYRIRAGYDVRVLDARNGAFVPATVEQLATGERAPAGVLLLPHVAPNATGNLCRADVPLPP
jgi:hypothetical protein